MPTKKPAAKPAKSTKASAPVRKVAPKAHAKPAPKGSAKAVSTKGSAHKPAAHEAKHVPKSAAKPITKTAPVVKAPAAKLPAVKAPPKSEAVAQPAIAVAATPARKPQPRTSATREAVAVAMPARTARPVHDAADGEDADGDGNLLAGPRNVTPYIAQRGEQYMSKEQLEHFRQILGSWKSDLMREVDRTVSHMKDEAANFPDPNDRATQEEEFSLELRTRDRERKLIRKIDEALQRIEDGSYGYCLETGEEIGIKRLEARPVATLSLEAQERRERREKQYGDRDDRYR
jgi:DnaK suppressor protein